MQASPTAPGRRMGGLLLSRVHPTASAPQHSPAPSPARSQSTLPGARAHTHTPPTGAHFIKQPGPPALGSLPTLRLTLTLLARSAVPST